MLAIIRKSTLGRPPLPGPRTPSGRRKPTGDPRARQVHHRLTGVDVAKAGLDPRIATQIGRLLMEGELTPTQAEAGFLVSRLYIDHAKACGLRPNAKGAGWAQSYKPPHR